MLGHTEVEYGDVKLVNCQTLKFEQEPVLDRSGQVHQFDRFTVRVSGYFLAQYEAATTISPKQTSSNSAAEHNRYVREKLSERSQPFTMTLGAGTAKPVILLKADPPPRVPLSLTPEEMTVFTDVRGGPEPKVINATRIVGDTSIKVEFEVVVCLAYPCGYEWKDENPTGAILEQQKFGILSNRWSCADELDENFWASRTWVGELKLAHPLRNPHEFRSLVVPPVQPGMRRARMSFQASEDNLSLQYQIRDEEVFLTAPSPATSIEMTHREHVGEWSHLVRTTFSVSVRGDRNASKKDLILLAMQVASGKLRLQQLVPAFGVARDRPVFVKSYELIDRSGTNKDNSVQLNIQMESRPANNKEGGLEDLFRRVTSTFGKPLNGEMIADYVNTLSRGNRPGEEPDWQGPIPLVGAFVSHLQERCTVDKSLFSGIQQSDRQSIIIAETREDLPALPQVDAYAFPNLPDIPDDTFNDSHSVGLYTHYDVDAEYESYPMVMQLPLAYAALRSEGPAPEEPSSELNFSNNPSLDGPSGNDGSDQPHSVFVRIGPTQHQRVVRLVAQRIGQPPRLPVPLESFTDKEGVQHVLLKSIDNAANPERTADGEAFVYTIRAEYRYGLDRPPRRIRMGKPDFEAESQSSSEPTAWDWSLGEIFSSDHSMG